MSYEMVIGLETHVELSTNTKIFCGCTTAFGGEPNTHCCPVCIGLPGVLPKLNEKVVEYACRAGLATNCKIAEKSKMDRKNYVYPDLPKAYQISQFDIPLCAGGHITLQNGRQIRINRIHIEEDAGKLVHENGDIYIDYNRGGVPLIEIVSEPDLRSAEEVREYLEEIQKIMRYIGVSDCKMQEGSLRCDVNVSLRKSADAPFGTRAEIKNMNSFTFITRAIEAEYRRQKDLLDAGQGVVQETRRYIEATGDTESMRDKEDSHDYRYFPDPDLVTIAVTKQQLAAWQKSIPELPAEKLARYTKTMDLPQQDALLLTKYHAVAAYFEELSALSGQPKAAASCMLGPVFRHLGTEEEKEACDLPPAAYLAELLGRAAGGTLPPALIKTFAERILQERKPLAEVATPEELSGAGQDEVLAIVTEVVQNNPQAVADYKAGKLKAAKALLGQVMRATKGRADPLEAEQLIVSALEKL